MIPMTDLPTTHGVYVIYLDRPLVHARGYVVGLPTLSPQWSAHDRRPTTNERATAPRFPIGQVTDPRLVTRIVALQAAATFAGGKALSTEVSTADVLKVAAAFLKWLEGGPLP